MQDKSTNFIKESNIKITFTMKEITSYGGFVLLAKLFENLKLKENINKIFPIEEESNNSTGIYSKILKYGLTVLSGGKRFSHSLYLGESLSVYKKLFGIKKMIKSDSPLTRLFGRIKTFKLATIFGKQLWEYIYDKIIPFNIIIEDHVNFDSTVLTRYGKQEGANKGYNSKKRGRPSHHPLIAFLNRARYIVNLWNRQGKAGSNNNIVAFAMETMERIKGKMKIKGTIADTGYYLLDFLKYLESCEIPYIIGVPISHIIQKMIVQIVDWTEVTQGINIGEFSFCHKTAGWDKEDFSMEGFCLDSFYATESAMLIRILFYNIINLFRNRVLPKKEKGKTFATIRKEYFIIPAIMGASGRINVLRLGVKSKQLRSKIKWLLNAIDKAFSNIVPNDLHLTENIVT